MGPNVWSIVIVAVLILVLFGGGKISRMMGDLGKGVSSFKKGLNEDESKSGDSAQIKGPDASPTSETAKDSKPGDTGS